MMKRKKYHGTHKRYHNDKKQLEKTRRNLFKKRRGSNQYSRSFIALMDEFVDNKDRWNFVKFGLFEELVTWEVEKGYFLSNSLQTRLSKFVS